MFQPREMDLQNQRFRSVAAPTSSALPAGAVLALSGVATKVSEPMQVDADDEVLSVDGTHGMYFRACRAVTCVSMFMAFVVSL